MNPLSSDFDQAAADWDSAAYRVQRARHIAHQIQELAPENQQGRILDFGCGTGLLGFIFIDKAQHIVFADTSAGMLAQVVEKSQGSPKASTHLIGATPLPGPFDLVVSLMVLHHIEDYAKSIGTLCAHLAPGGQIFLCDLVSEDGSFHGDTKVPHNGFEPSHIAQILQGSGLRNAQTRLGHVDYKVRDGARREYPIFIASGEKL